jgi:ethanolamine ammonia-lyase small subunit
MKHELITTDPWNSLRSATPARIALGRAGGSLPTREWLDFKAAHSAARDAVHQVFDAESVSREISLLGIETILLDTAAGDRQTFLKRPDLGRRLDAASDERLRARALENTAPDLAIVVSDGLSALAVQRQAPPLLTLLVPRLIADGWRLAPIAVVRFGRVALEDHIGQRFGARLALLLLGERPGLGSPDSLGAYLVHAPQPGNTDANRNCVSNIRPAGLAWDAAADTIVYLLSEARRRQLSGVALKDERAPLLHKFDAQNKGSTAS